MATIAIKDARNPAQRSTVEPSPVWLTSGYITSLMTGCGAVAFMFDKAWGAMAAVHAAIFEVIVPFAGGTPSISVGDGTIVNGDYSFEDNTTVTIGVADSIIPSVDITEGTAGKYPALTGAAVTLWAAGQMKLITCSDSAIPVVYATLSASLTAGKGRLHLLTSFVPVA